MVYDQNNQTQYYNFSRKATVTVKEKNFSPDLVVWNIQGSNQKYQIGEWKNVQGTYVCEISFEEDGRDYSVGLFSPNYNKMDVDWSDKARQQERGFMFENRYRDFSIELPHSQLQFDDLRATYRIENVWPAINMFQPASSTAFCARKSPFSSPRITAMTWQTGNFLPTISPSLRRLLHWLLHSAWRKRWHTT